MGQNRVLDELAERTKRAVAHYWGPRSAQRRKQEQSGKADQGFRSAVTGGAHMDGFIDLFTELITQAGIHEQYIFRKKAVELPGFFRPTKEWDLPVVKEPSSPGEEKIGLGSAQGVEGQDISPHSAGANHLIPLGVPLSPKE